MSRVSVVIPFHRADENFFLALRSAQRQRFADMAIVLMNDGVDPAEVEQIVDSDRRVTHIVDGDRVGLQARLNLSIESVDSEFYFRMDSDDVMHPDRVRKQVEFFDSHPEVSVLGTSAYIMDSSGSILGVRGRADGLSRVPTAVKPSVFIHPSVAFRSKWIAEYRYDEKLKRTEDKDLWIRGYTPGSYAHLGEPLLYYREHFRQTRYVIRQTAREERCLAVRDRTKNGLVRTGRYVLSSFVKEGAKTVVEPIAPEILRRRRFSTLSGSDLEFAQRGLQDAVGLSSG